MRILAEGGGDDAPLLAADLDSEVGKSYRALEAVELEAITAAAAVVGNQPRFAPFLPAVPDERIPTATPGPCRPRCTARAPTAR